MQVVDRHSLLANLGFKLQWGNRRARFYRRGIRTVLLFKLGDLWYSEERVLDRPRWAHLISLSVWP